MIKRYVALGDSFTEGVGDVDPTRPNGVRGWADRVAEVLGGCWSTEYANLAIRGRKLGLMATKVLDRLGLGQDLPTPEPLKRAVLSVAEQRAANLAWTREHLGPWVKRRLTGTSSGDGLSPRYPAPQVIG